MSLLALLAATGTAGPPDPPDPTLVMGFTAYDVGHHRHVLALSGETVESPLNLVAATSDPIITLPYTTDATWTGRASIVLPGGVAHPLTVGGSTSLSITSATDCDPLLGVTIPTSGALFRVYSTGSVPVPEWHTQPERRAAGDLTGGGAITVNTSLARTQPVPYAIRGMSTYAGPQVLLLGDSITTIEDWYHYSPTYGTMFTQPLRAAGVPAVMCGLWGAAFSHIASAPGTLTVEGHRRLDAVLATGLLTHAITQYGVNDIYGAGGGSAPYTAAANVWNILASHDLELWHTTTTLAGGTAGTPHAFNSVRVAWNNDLRDGLAPLAGAIEVADTLETARNSGLWAAPTVDTDDGTHPTAAGVAKMRVPIAAWAATL